MRPVAAWPTSVVVPRFSPGLTGLARLRPAMKGRDDYDDAPHDRRTSYEHRPLWSTRSISRRGDEERANEREESRHEAPELRQPRIRRRQQFRPFRLPTHRTSVGAHPPSPHDLLTSNGHRGEAEIWTRACRRS